MDRELPPQVNARKSFMASTTRALTALAMTLSISVAVAQPVRADELDDRKEALAQQLKQQQQVVRDAHVAEDNAVTQAAAARQRLADAETKLAAAEKALSSAETLDAQRAKELKEAEDAVSLANARVEAARVALEAVDRRANQEIIVSTQDTTGLVNLALIFTDVDTSNLNQRVQLADTLLTQSAKQLDELESKRIVLEDAQAAATKAEEAAEEARKAAADQLASTKKAHETATQLRAEVADLVKKRDAAEVAAKNAVAAEEKKQAALEQESAAVEKRIQARIAAEKAAAARAAAAKAAAERKAAAARAAAAKKKSSSTTSSSKTSRQSTTSRSSSSSSSSNSGSFLLPVNSYITSPFGKRLHPIFKVWKMHDGTDFGASCGTPIVAPAAGVVSERYYSGGYGNRLMIDHGKINGSYVTTGYNHATRYIVSVGQRVSRGQVIGYVGSTGYSTGCHLHLMTWENGRVVNPMAKWF